ncbi:hemerythrin domain-containing protein [Nocardioides sp. 503]|uniref:hemerythrin domain-containing protein n=1 Tax=Nocardioides sp. 503 TaxID=2508326 RepID=UPI00106FB956|nr:hemerythrin domain-containing protein [Nocardioides sp. 503]
MCEHCGCKGVEPIGELMAEHSALAHEAHHVRGAVAVGDHAGAMALLHGMVDHLVRHVSREEDGIFRAMRASGEFLEELDALEGEHRDLESVIAGLDIADPAFASTVSRLLDDLDQHIEREDLGIFPVSVVTLGASGWAVVDGAHERTPSFLVDGPGHAWTESGAVPTH